MYKIDEIIQQFELGMAKSIVCLIGSGLSFFASSNTDGITANAAGVTGWALAISTIVVLAKTVKHLFEMLGKKDEKIEALHQKLFETAQDKNDE